MGSAFACRGRGHTSQSRTRWPVPTVVTAVSRLARVRCVRTEIHNHIYSRICIRVCIVIRV